nr:TolC family protein [Oceanospirillum sediminis]
MLFQTGLVFLLAGCASSPHMSDDAVPVPEIGDQHPSVKNEAGQVKKLPAVTVPDDKYFGRWWRYLGNDELVMLIDRAIINNQQLQISAQRVVQAKARAGQEAAASLPVLDFRAGYSVEAPGRGIGSVPKGRSPNGDEEYELKLDASYTVDLWGQRKSLADSAELKLQQAVYQYDAQLLQTITDLTKNYLQYLSINDRIRNAQESEKDLMSMLQGMKDLYEQGDATVVEMEIQKSSVYSTRTVLPTLLLQKAQLVNQIAIQTGSAPGALHLSDQGLSSVSFPSEVTGISSSYVLRRPDIRALESAMQAADADLEVARTEVLPALNLSAGIGYGARKVSDLLQPHTLMWDFIANLTLNVFDGGRQQQQIRLAQSVRSELVETYVFNIYSGLQRAKDALFEIDFTHKRLQLQDESVRAAKAAKELGFEAYRAGGIDFLTFLDSSLSYQQRRDEQYNNNLEYYLAFVDLYTALGGGIPYREVPGTVSLTQWQDEFGWQDKPSEYEPEDDAWFVRISGVYDRFAVEAMLRDFVRRYPADMKSDLNILVQPLVGDSQNNPQQVWYVLNVDGFDDEGQARQWCEMLRQSLQRCSVFQPEDDFRLSARFSIAEMSSAEHEARLPPGDWSPVSPQAGGMLTAEANYISRAGKPMKINFGKAYSLLKIENGTAWLIGNNTHRIWKVNVGDDLHYNGRVVEISVDGVVLEFSGKHYFLKPVYQLQSTVLAPDGRWMAHLRWGGASNKLFTRRVGDKVYGSGVIRVISETGVIIEWGKRSKHLIDLKTVN